MIWSAMKLSRARFAIEHDLIGRPVLTFRIMPKENKEQKQ
jgi:hypothetical protein